MTSQPDDLLKLLGPALTAVAREIVQRALADVSLTSTVGATVLSGADDGGTATVRIDGDPTGESTPATLTGLSVNSGDRVLVLLGQSTSYVIGGLGEATSGGSVDLSNYVTFTDLATAIAGVTVTQPFTYPFAMQGDLGAITSKFPWPISSPQFCDKAGIMVHDATSGSASTWNFVYQGASVLSADLVLPAGAAIDTPFYSTSFALPTLVPPGAGLDGFLRGVCVSPDSGNTGQNATLWLDTLSA